MQMLLINLALLLLVRVRLPRLVKHRTSPRNRLIQLKQTVLTETLRFGVSYIRYVSGKLQCYCYLGTAPATVTNTPAMNTPAVNTNMMQPPPNMMPMQHRMPNQFGGPIATQFGAAPFGMPPPGFQPFGGYGPPQGNWGNANCICIR